MSAYSVAKAKNQLSELIDRALKGEGVVITRHGHPVIELKPIPEPVRAVSGSDLDWLSVFDQGMARRKNGNALTIATVCPYDAWPRPRLGNLKNMPISCATRPADGYELQIGARYSCLEKEAASALTPFTKRTQNDEC